MYNSFLQSTNAPLRLCLMNPSFRAALAITWSVVNVVWPFQIMNEVDSQVSLSGHRREDNTTQLVHV